MTVVDKNLDRKGTRKVAEAYLQYRYSDEGQEIAAKNFCRPINEKVKAKFDAPVTYLSTQPTGATTSTENVFSVRAQINF